MVTPERLEALDLTIWLGTESLAAEKLSCTQSTISRRNRDVKRLFQVQRVRDDLTLTWALAPDSLLLEMERQVHQLHRWLQGDRLRIEADAWLAALLPALPDRWIRGTLDGLGVARPLGLLRARVIDAWLTCSSHDLPPANDPDLLVIELVRLPLLVVAHPHHPLVGRTNLQPQDLARFPSLSLGDHLYPRFAAAIRSLGLWTQPVPLQRYKRASWEGLTTDQLTLAYANALSLLLPPQLEPLKYQLPLEANVALVVSRDLAGLQPQRDLCQRLHTRAMELLAQAPQPLVA